MSEDAYGSAGRSAWMDVDWREHLRWVRIDGAPVNVVDNADLRAFLEEKPGSLARRPGSRTLAK